MSNKDKENGEQPEPPPKNVIPIHDGQVQPECSPEQAIEDLSNKQPTLGVSSDHD